MTRIQQFFLAIIIPLLIPSLNYACGYPEIRVSGNAWDFSTHGGTLSNPASGAFFIKDGDILNLNFTTIVFDEDATLTVDDGGVLNANYVTFKSAGEEETWGGLRLKEGGENDLSEMNLNHCHVENAFWGIANGCSNGYHKRFPVRLQVLNSEITNPVEHGINLFPSDAVNDILIKDTEFRYDKDPSETSSPWFNQAFFMVRAQTFCGMKVENCLFLNEMDPSLTPINFRGNGMQLSESLVEVDSNIFKHWQTGISASVDGECGGSYEFLGNKFKNCRWGIRMYDLDNVRVIGNAFIMNSKMDLTWIPSYGSSKMTGLTVGGNCREIQIRENLFRHRETGTNGNVFSQEFVGLELGDVLGATIKNNEFDFQLLDNRNEDNVMVRVLGKNSSTYITCNQFNFDPGRADGQWGWLLDSKDATLADQGSWQLGTGNSWTTVMYCGTNHQLARIGSAGTFDYFKDPVGANPTCVSFGINLYNASTTQGCIGTSKTHTAPQPEEAPEFAIFPNPTNGKLTVRLPQNHDPLQLFTAHGQKIDPGISDAGMSEIQLDLSHLPAGIYFLRSGNMTKRVVLQ